VLNVLTRSRDGIKGQSTSSVERILLKPYDGIVPSVFSSNILDNASHLCESNITRWNINRLSAG
jgi:hypothetical protein